MSCAKVCQSVPGLGNTSTSPSRKVVNPCIRWCFTLNNWTEEELSSICSICSVECRYAVVGQEVGEKGTPHLQGYIEFKTKKRPIKIFGIKRIHWEVAKFSKEHNTNYCKKDGKYFMHPKEYKIKLPNMYGWERDIIKILEEEPDDRSIYWFWETEGCKGKTTFQKWIFQNYDRVLCLSGKGSDMKNGIVQYKNKTCFLPKVVLINIPRSSSGFVSYTGMEEIKDMWFYSGKYEGGMVCGPNPHVLVFSNAEPDYEKMSGDRWKVRDLGYECEELAN